MTETKEVAKTEKQNFELSLFEMNGLGAMMKLSSQLANADIIPETFQKKPANILIALEMAQRMHASPFAIMQNMYIVYGNPSFSSKFLISCFNGCGKYTSIKYEFFGTPGADDYGCRAYAYEKLTGEKVVGADVTIKIAKDEGWYSKKGSKWQTMPQLMLQYRAATFLIRTTAPELTMGMSTVDELEDTVIDISPANASSFSAEQHKLTQEVEAITAKSVEVDMPVQQEPVQENIAEAVPVPEVPKQAARPAWMAK